MHSKTKAVLAKAIETTTEALILIMESGSVFDSLGKVFRAACPRIPGRTQSSRTLAFRLWHPLALD